MRGWGLGTRLNLHRNNSAWWLSKLILPAATSRPDSSSRVPLEVNQKHFSWRKAILHYLSYGSYFTGWSLAFPPQIADFGMSRDLDDDNYYISHGGKIPIKWTSPEVCDWRESAVKMISCMLCGWIKAANKAIHTISLQCGQYGMHCSVISNQPATKAAIFFMCNASVYLSVTCT